MHNPRSTHRGAALALAAVLIAGPALALDLPPRKPGLWQLDISVNVRGGASGTLHHCIDAATDSAMNDIGGGADQCTIRNIERAGNSMTIDWICKVGAGTITSHAVVTGDLNSAYTAKTTTTREGGIPAPPDLPAEMVTTTDAKWIGPCAADQQPGDIFVVLLGNVMKWNIKDLKPTPGGMKK